MSTLHCSSKAHPRAATPTPPKNIHVHRDQPPPTKPRVHPAYTKDWNTRRASTPTSTSAYHHNTPMPTLDRDMQKQHAPIKAEGPNPSSSSSSSSLFHNKLQVTAVYIELPNTIQDTFSNCCFKI